MVLIISIIVALYCL